MTAADDNVPREQAQWFGSLSPTGVSEAYLDQVSAVADAAKSYAWDKLLGLVRQDPDLVASWRIGGRSLYTALHQAAHGGAPAAVVSELIALGAFRTLKCARGDRPVDIARTRGHADLVPLLEPEVRFQVEDKQLAMIQALFQGLIRSRLVVYGIEAELRLPELSILTERIGLDVWFPIPGMYGGFSFHLSHAEGDQAVLIAENWCRVVGGSGERHRVSTAEVVLEEAGFV